MKTFDQILSDIKSLIPNSVSGLQLDILANTFAMYAYDTQAIAVSQLLENNIDTAININSLIAKASQYGVSVPRVHNPELEFEVKSVSADTTIELGEEVITIGKYRFLYLGYYDESHGNVFTKSKLILSSTFPILIRCMVCRDVVEYSTDKDVRKIFSPDWSDIADTVFIYYKGNYMHPFDRYADYLSYNDEDKVLITTTSDYGVKITTEGNPSLGTYNIKLPKSMTDVSELIGLIESAEASDKVTVSKYRSGTEDSNIKIVDLGSDVLSKSELVTYIEYNLNRTQLIKSNNDLIEYVASYLHQISEDHLMYKVNFYINKNLTIYVNDMYYDTNTDISPIKDRLYIGIDNIVLKSGVQLDAAISLEFNNQIDNDLINNVTNLVSEYNDKFNTLIDELTLVSDINALNPLLKVTNIKVEYSAHVRIGKEIYIIPVSEDNYTKDQPNLEFTEAPEVGTEDNPIIYKLYKTPATFLKTSIIWT